MYGAAKWHTPDVGIQGVWPLIITRIHARLDGRLKRHTLHHHAPIPSRAGPLVGLIAIVLLTIGRPHCFGLAVSPAEYARPAGGSPAKYFIRPPAFPPAPGGVRPS